MAKAGARSRLKPADIGIRAVLLVPHAKSVVHSGVRESLARRGTNYVIRHSPRTDWNKLDYERSCRGSACSNWIWELACDGAADGGGRDGADGSCTMGTFH